MAQGTHDIRIDGHTVVKRYRSWDRGEPDREWAGLTLLDRFAPGLAPEPIERRTEQGAPVVVMSRLPGRPLGEGAPGEAAPGEGAPGGGPLGRDELEALAGALGQLHAAVPADHLRRLGERRWAPGELKASLRSWIDDDHPPVDAPVRTALDAGRAWLATVSPPWLSEEPVFGLADGNLANILWDGRRCRVVDLEDCGASDRAYEVADLLEHVSVSLPGLVPGDALVDLLEFTPRERDRLVHHRRLFSVFWLLMLLPGNPAHARNPEGSVVRQAERVLSLL